MSISGRLDLYRRIETKRNCPLIVYATSPRQNAIGNMAGDVIPFFLDQANLLPQSDRVDLLLVSQGGDPTVAWRLMSLLRERCNFVSVLLPQAAYSAATLLALGADEIVMHPNANLGPVDPQVTINKPPVKENGPPVTAKFGYEDLTNFLKFVRDEVELSDQDSLRTLFAKFCDEVGAVSIGVAVRGGLLTVSMGEKLLRMHMTEADDADKAKQIAEQLAKNYFHHGYAVSRMEAKEIGLKVAEPDQETEQLIWSVWADIEEEFEARQPFNPLAAVMRSNEGTKLLSPAPQLNIPAGTPPQLIQQVLGAILATMQQEGTLMASIEPVQFTVRLALLESIRGAAVCSASGKILASRTPDLKLNCVPVTEREGWSNVDMSDLPT